MSEILDRLRDHSQQTARQWDIDYALSIVYSNLDTRKAHRCIAGVAVSSKAKNTHGQAFVARGLSIELPRPLLLYHDFLRPIGKVTGIEIRGDAVHWTAELANSGRLSSAEDAWMHVMCKFVTGASVGPRNLANYPPNDGTFFNWGIDEISIVDDAADHGAHVTKVWERAPVIYLDGRPSETVFWSTPSW